MVLTWRKSSLSGAGGSGNSGGDCVEIAFGPDGPVLRDSKAGDRGALLHTNHDAFDALVRVLKHAR